MDMCTIGNMIKHPNADDEAELVEENQFKLTGLQT